MRSDAKTGARRGLLACAVALCGALCPLPYARAAELSDIPAAFVDVGIGAREMAMGGAAVATSSGPLAVFWNAARLAAPETGDAVALTHGTQMGIVPYSAAAGSKRFGEGWVLGAGVLYSGDDVLSEMTGIVSAARSFAAPPWLPHGPVSLGLSLRVRRASYGNNESAGTQVTGSATGYAADMGAVIPLSETVRLAVSGRDIAGVLTWRSSSSGTYEEGVPPGLIAGLAVGVADDALLEVDLDKALAQDCRNVVSVGAEVALFNVAAIRGGYRRGLEPHELEEFSVGGGAIVDAACAELELDVAYVFGELDDTLRLGVVLSF